MHDRTDDQHLTMSLAEWAASIRPRDIPEEVRHQAHRVILDYLAAAIAGSASAAARIVQRMATETDRDGSATVTGTDLRLSPGNAALANGTAAHGLEVDDGYTPGAFHPGAPVLSAVLAAAEARKSPPEMIILATVLGYEVSCRLAGAAHPATWRRGFHNTPIAGVFGAAVGVSRLLGVGDARGIANALGLAGSHAGGLFEFLEEGAEVKRLHAGKAGRDGLLSAELAAHGLTGPTTVLEGPYGYIRAFAGDEASAFDADHLLGGLGETWRMLRTYVKPYPCCRHLHGPIDAVSVLRKQAPIDVGAIDRITVQTYAAAARHDLRPVSNLLEAQMSMPYAIAAALVHGELGLEAFGADARGDPEIARLLGLVEVEVADDCERVYPAKRPSRVTIQADGRERSVRVDQPYGEPDNAMTDADLRAKFGRLTRPVVGAERSARIRDVAWTLTDPAELFAALQIPGSL